jgi:hypothetical protein
MYVLGAVVCFEDSKDLSHDCCLPLFAATTLDDGAVSLEPPNAPYVLYGGVSDPSGLEKYSRLSSMLKEKGVTLDSSSGLDTKASEKGASS